MDHLFVCPKCCQLYGVLCDRAEQFHQERAEAEGRVLPAVPAISIENVKAQFWRRIEAKEAQEKRDRRRQFIYRIGKVALAAAACLLLAIGVLTSPGVVSPVGQAPPSVSAVSPHRESLEGERFGTPVWIVEAQAALRTRGIEADCLDLLMISGDFRQFQFDPTASFDQPLAACQPSSMDRLARHYGVPVELLQRSYKRDSALATQVTPKKSLARWQSALAAAENTPGGPSADLLLLSLRACTFLAKTRAGAAAWVHNHPEESRVLLASSQYRSACEIPSRIRDAHHWSQHLANQANAATQGIQAVNELLRMATWDRCVAETSENWRQLKQSVETLLASEGGTK